MDSERMELLRRARGGDKDAVAQLLIENEPYFRRMVAARCSDGLREKVRPSDILQSTYREVIGATFLGQSEGDFLKWVTSILDHNVRDVARYHQAEKRRARFASVQDAIFRVSDESPGPSAQLAAQEEVDLAQRAMAALRPGHRDVLRLFILEGRTHAEIAAEMGKTPEATRTLLLRARVALFSEIQRMQASGDAGLPDEEDVPPEEA